MTLKQLSIKSKHRSLFLIGFIVLSLYLSLNSLTTFRDPFHDEGEYAAFGYNAVNQGTFLVQPDALTNELFKKGDGIHSRINPYLFGYLGKFFGYSLTTARAITFAQIWIGAFLFFYIAQALGVSGFLGVLLFVVCERVFWASHAFRPEATLIFTNTLFVFFILYFKKKIKLKNFYVGRGIFNGLFVLSHGNGFVAAMINSIDATLKAFRNKKWIKLLLFYTIGSLFGVGLFYLVQPRAVGGWRTFFDQIHTLDQYVPDNSIFAALQRDFTNRWYKEIFGIGGSLASNLFRLVSYIIIFSITVLNIIKQKGESRRLGLFVLANVFGYVFFVGDKIDIHIAEMYPFFLASVLCFYGQYQNNKKAKFWATSVVGLFCALQFLLMSHHAIQYRKPVWYYSEPLEAAQKFLKKHPSEFNTVVIDMKYWFDLHDDYHVMSMTFARHYPSFSGEQVLLINPRVGDIAASGLKNCKPKIESKHKYYQAFDCR